MVIPRYLFPLLNWTKIPSIRDQIKEFLGLEVMSQSTQVVDDNEDAPIILQTMSQEGRKNPSHQPFFISLVVGDLLLHNYMLFWSLNQCNVSYCNESIRIKNHNDHIEIYVQWIL
jgi:hypothetical protein